MQKIGLLTLLMAAAILLMVAFPAVAAGPNAPAPPVPAAPTVAATSASALPVPAAHPHIHGALEAIRNAKHHLESAEHDFDGHRSKAIEHLDQALREAENLHVDEVSRQELRVKQKRQRWTLPFAAINFVINATCGQGKPLSGTHDRNGIGNCWG